jgi:hypothetical protein
VCPRQGHKVFTLQTIPSWEDGDYGTNQVGKMAGFSLHAGVATKRVNVRSWNDCVAISLLLIRKIPGADFSGNGDVRVEDTVPRLNEGSMGSESLVFSCYSAIFGSAREVRVWHNYRVFI